MDLSVGDPFPTIHLLLFDLHWHTVRLHINTRTTTANFQQAYFIFVTILGNDSSSNSPYLISITTTGLVIIGPGGAGSWGNVVWPNSTPIINSPSRLSLIRTLRWNLFVDLSSRDRNLSC
jgi:hypothetical protein